MGSLKSPLAAAFVAQSVFAARCEVFAQKADKGHREREAALFRALGRAAGVHARKALLLLRGKVGGTGDNLAECILDRRDLVQALPQASESTASAGDKPATALLRQMLEAARSHCDRLRGMDDGVDAAYHVCGICGFVAGDEVPEQCPVCHAVREKFETVM